MSRLIRFELTRLPLHVTWPWALVAVLTASYVGLKSFASLVQASPYSASLAGLTVLSGIMIGVGILVLGGKDC